MDFERPSSIPQELSVASKPRDGGFVRTIDVAQFDLPEFFEYLKTNRSEIVRQLQSGKALYFPWTPLKDQVDFKRALQTINPQLMEYSGAKFRQNLDDPSIYSPTSTPPDRINYLHHELGYQKTIPEGLALFCQRQAPTGGESLLGDSREWYQAIAPEVRRNFETKGLLVQRVLAPRNVVLTWLSNTFDLFKLMPSWQGNFQTESRQIAEDKARRTGHDVEWTPRGQMILRTQIIPTRQHPLSAEKMWVNNAHLFQLHPDVFGPKMFWLFTLFFRFTRSPMTTIVWANGEKIPKEFTSEILRASQAVQKTILLKNGGLVLLNNHCISHGRLPFSGPRRLMFAMFEKLNPDQDQNL